MQLYSGSFHKIAFNYSLLLWFIFVAFLFGLQMPIVFPLCTLGMFNLFVSEKIMLVYFHAKPPNYNKRITHTVYRIASVAPLFMYALGYWALGNPQFFKNIVP